MPTQESKSMSSIYGKITVKRLDYLDTDGLKKITVTKVQFLRMHSAIARNETDEQIQTFFDAFNI